MATLKHKKVQPSRSQPVYRITFKSDESIAEFIPKDRSQLSDADDLHFVYVYSRLDNLPLLRSGSKTGKVVVMNWEQLQWYYDLEVITREDRKTICLIVGDTPFMKGVYLHYYPSALKIAIS